MIVLNILELIKRCNESKDSDGFDFWEDHIKYVVENAVALTKEYVADADVMAHFDSIPALFSLAFKEFINWSGKMWLIW